MFSCYHAFCLIITDILKDEITHQKYNARSYNDFCTSKVEVRLPNLLRNIIIIIAVCLTRRPSMACSPLLYYGHVIYAFDASFIRCIWAFHFPLHDRRFLLINDENKNADANIRRYYGKLDISFAWFHISSALVIWGIIYFQKAVIITTPQSRLSKPVAEFYKFSFSMPRASFELRWYYIGLLLISMAHMLKLR